LPQLAENAEAFCSATRDIRQAEVAQALGLDVL
jgi:hypothetical protein